MREKETSSHIFHFTDYLEAKMEVDERSKNSSVLRTFKKLFLKKTNPVIVDLGTGTGMMIRRFLSLPLHGNVVLYGVDNDPGCCTAALYHVKNALLRLGYAVKTRSDRISAEKQGTFVRIHIVQADILDPSFPGALGIAHAQCITANAFMDLILLKDGMKHIFEFLEEGGILYSTINYDGLTTLLPQWRNHTFEQSLLSLYDKSMDERLIHGHKTGGSRTGSLIFSAAQEVGLHVADLGSSDWQIFPKNGRYKRGEKFFLKSIVSLIYQEVGKSNRVDHRELDAWYTDRLRQSDLNALALITHQTDIVAEKPVKKKSVLPAANQYDTSRHRGK
jgi:hypothetical protein